MNIPLGACFRCKNENIRFDSAIIEDTMLYYPYSCPDCGYSGREVYSIEYLYTE